MRPPMDAREVVEIGGQEFVRNGGQWLFWCRCGDLCDMSDVVNDRCPICTQDNVEELTPDELDHMKRRAVALHEPMSLVVTPENVEGQAEAASAVEWSPDQKKFEATPDNEEEPT